MAIFQKEIRTELRSKSGLMTAALFGFGAIIAASYPTIIVRYTPPIAGGVLWVVLLFAASISLPRTFTSEEELGTGDLLRLWSNPFAVYWGKTLANLLQLLILGAVLSGLFILLTGITVFWPGLFVVSLIGSCACLAAGVTLSGSLVSQAAQRSTLASAVSLPLLIPILLMGLSAFRASFEAVSLPSGWPSALGLVAYSAISLALGPYLFAGVWKR